MVCIVGVLSLFFFCVGESIRYSRCISSHQKGADCLEGVDSTFVLIVLAWSWKKRLLFVFFKKYCQVEQKWVDCD